MIRILLVSIFLVIETGTVAFAQTAAETAQLPNIDQLKSRLEITGSEPEIEAEKNKLREAITLLEQAATNETETVKFRQELATGTQRTRQIRAQIESLPAPGTSNLKLPETGQSSAIEEILVEQRAELADLNNQLTRLEKEIALHRARPDKIVSRKVELQNEIADAEGQFSTLANAGENGGGTLSGDQVLALAKIRAAQVETTLLEQERLSHTVKESRLSAERDLLSRRIEFGQSLLNDLVGWQNTQLQKEVDQVANSAAKAKIETAGQHPEVKKLAEQLRQLSGEFESITTERQKVGASLREARFNLEELTRNHQLLKAQLDIDGMSGVFGEVILEQSRNLPSLTKTKSRLRALRKQLGQARLGQFRNEENLRNDPSKEIALLLDNAPDTVKSQIPELITKQTEVKEQIKSEYQRLIRDLNELELAEHQFAEKISEVGAYLDEKRIWVRGSKVVGLETITNLPEAIAWLMNPLRIAEIPGAVTSEIIRQPFLSILGALVLFSLFVAKWRLVPRLKTTAAYLKNTSPDRYIDTVKALLFTIILGLPFPLLTLFSGILLQQGTDSSDWLRGLGNALVAVSPPLATICLVRQLCRKDGLAEAHFSWPKNTVCSLRRNLTWIAVVLIPGIIIQAFTLSKEEMGHFDSLGRLCFMFTMGWAAFFIARLLKPRSGIFSARISDNPRSLTARFSPIWYPCVTSLPIALCILAAIGYPLAAIALAKELRFTTEMIFLGVVFYSMLLRWGTMRVRRMALEKHLADRQAAREKAISTDGEHGDEIGISEMETKALDLATVGDQTRRMFRFIAGVAVAITVWYSSVDIFPAFQTLDEIKILGDISLSRLIPSILIVVATIITARNLPGILEIFLQRFLTLDSGLRFATTTIAQYLIVTVGFLFVFNTLGLDWSKFGWIAAALSVGLGFGMQEIVANFVCGIILLFERPIRIGDIVTVSGTTGAVSRIQIRATTITNWDRQEFVVPNKEIVTGSLLNWTLSNPLSRIVITVGVAYGSDTRRVREILFEILAAQEGILTDPEPIVTFEEFADSSLNFTIRAYIPGLEKRLATLNDLNQSINDRFREEGVEIPFPQRDLNIKTTEKKG
ncbi:MAG: mechanosensitive ion channel [Verrucomicrobiales bacterium]|nr:mechanosensitive ion channel [Verrucomicrobiales bacterium]